jgi:hypothetical protein
VSIHGFDERRNRGVVVCRQHEEVSAGKALERSGDDVDVGVR